MYIYIYIYIYLFIYLCSYLFALQFMHSRYLFAYAIGAWMLGINRSHLTHPAKEYRNVLLDKRKKGTPILQTKWKSYPYVCWNTGKFMPWRDARSHDSRGWRRKHDDPGFSRTNEHSMAHIRAMRQVNLPWFSWTLRNHWWGCNEWGYHWFKLSNGKQIPE